MRDTKTGRIAVRVLLILLLVGFAGSGRMIFWKKAEENRLSSQRTENLPGQTDQTEEAQQEQMEDIGDTAGSQTEDTTEDGQKEEGREDPPQPTKPLSARDWMDRGAAVPEGYFSDTLFVGDSRTVGLREYGQMQGAQFFANTGMSVYQIYNQQISIPEIGRVHFLDLIKQRQYGKIYIMLGINELGYNMNTTVKKYAALIDTIRQYQPHAVIYIEANLHVTQERSNRDAVFNNANIDRFNGEIAKFADKKSIYYVDVNPLFDDGAGNLAAEYTNDSTHVLGKYYRVWANWLATAAAGN